MLSQNRQFFTTPPYHSSPLCLLPPFEDDIVYGQPHTVNIVIIDQNMHIFVRQKGPTINYVVSKLAIFYHSSPLCLLPPLEDDIVYGQPHTVNIVIIDQNMQVMPLIHVGSCIGL
jgi:hypothetical protein